MFDFNENTINNMKMAVGSKFYKWPSAAVFRELILGGHTVTFPSIYEFLDNFNCKHIENLYSVIYFYDFSILILKWDWENEKLFIRTKVFVFTKDLLDDISWD